MALAVVGATGSTASGRVAVDPLVEATTVVVASSSCAVSTGIAVSFLRMIIRNETNL